MAIVIPHAKAFRKEIPRCLFTTFYPIRYKRIHVYDLNRSVIPGTFNISPRHSFGPLQPIPSGWIKLPRHQPVSGAKVSYGDRAGAVLSVLGNIASLHCKTFADPLDTSALEIIPSKYQVYPQEGSSYPLGNPYPMSDFLFTTSRIAACEICRY